MAQSNMVLKSHLLILGFESSLIFILSEPFMCIKFVSNCLSHEIRYTLMSVCLR